MRKFLIVVERAGANFSAYSPDLAGCVAAGSTREETMTNMRTAIKMHVEGLREDGQAIPDPSAVAEYVDVV